jgi:hypothetical protein
MTRILLVLLTLSFVLMPAAPAEAHGKESYSIEILVDGRPLEKHVARGRSYIEAVAGREYSIRLRNNTARRVAIALSVDGLNTIDAKASTPKQASKWILGPHQTITLDGWQTSSKTARRFFFTTEEESYGAWLGKTNNLGVITAAVFREKKPQPIPIYQGGEKQEGKSRRRPDTGAQAPAPSSEPGRQSDQPVEMDDDLAATGIGRQLDHDVRRVHFNAERSPAAVLEIRYEYHDALVRLGVLPREYVPCGDPLSRRENAHGFEGMDFAPDPYAPGCP